MDRARTNRPLEVPFELARLPRLNTHWVIGLAQMPATIAGETVSHVLLVLDPRQGTILAGDVVVDLDPMELRSRLAEICSGRNQTGVTGLPRALTFSDELLYDAWREGLTAIGVTCQLDLNDPMTAHVVQQMQLHLDGDAEVTAWRRAERGLVVRVEKQIDRRYLLNTRSLARYFGSAAVGDWVLSQPFGVLPEDCWREWLLMDYRPTRKSKTLAERLLKRVTLPSRERALIEARQQTSPSFWQVLASDSRTEQLEIRNIWTRRRVAIRDQRLARTATVGMCLPGRLVETEPLRFLPLMGPPIMAGELEDYLDYLYDRGLEVDDKGGVAQPQLIGRLWEPWTANMGAPAAEPGDDSP